MNETLYWIIEYLKVLIAYGLIMYVWPLIVFNRFLKDKSRTFRFSFCTVVMINLINTVAILLGTVHILNVWVFRVLFFGVFIFFLVRKVRIDRKQFVALKHTIFGTMGKKTFTENVLYSFRNAIKHVLKKIGLYFKGNVVAYCMLLAVVIYGMLYFSWQAFQDYSYGASDMYVHHQWAYGLLQGEPYSAGIYPEGMHCMIYAIKALFGVDIYSSLMMLAGIHIAVTFLSAYVLFKDIFKWKYTPVLVLILFSILDVVGTFPVQSMARMSWTIPQEYGFPMIFLCGAYLIKYLKRKNDDKAKKFFNENLIIFILALAGTVTIHFYVTIMAFFLCLMIVIPLIPKLFKNRSFVNLVLAVLLGVFIAFVPMLAALAGGKKFQGSIRWAISIIKDSIAFENQIDREEVIEEACKFIDSNKNIIMPLAFGQGTGSGNIFKNNTSSRSAIRAPKRNTDEIYQKTYVFMHGKERAQLILTFEIIVFAIWIALKVFLVILHRKDEDYKATFYDGYIMLVLLGVMFNLLNNTRSLGLPEFMEVGRVCAITHILSIAIFFVPIDLIMSFPLYKINKYISAVAAVVSALSVIVITVASGHYHSYLYYCLGRYNGAVECAFSIMKDTNPDEFTIVSTTEEYYQIVEEGYHEELVDFVNSAYYKESYTLPTKYIFIFVEKKPIKYPHYHFASGPEFLAKKEYPSYFGTFVSQDPDIICGEITDEYANTDYGRFASGTINVYSNIDSRCKLESKGYLWCQKFNELYPGELHTYYEDDYFVCYYFKQNQRSIYELSIMN